MNSGCNRYDWFLEDGGRAELSLSPHLDNLIRKYRNNVTVESASFMDCGSVSVMPSIMRYCFEAGVDLREREFLRELPDVTYEIDARSMAFIKADFQRPLSDGTVRSVNGQLVINSLPRGIRGEISFSPKDVSELVEGIIKVLDYDGTRLGQMECVQIVHLYHQCLDSGRLRFRRHESA